MENATKALMIAGAVLIAIMIIGIGMMIYQNASGTITGAMDQTKQLEIDAFNSDLVAFEGPQRGTTIKQMITKVITLNSTNLNVNDHKVIKVNDQSDPNELASLRSQVTAGKLYTVTLGYGPEGYINTITYAE